MCGDYQYDHNTPISGVSILIWNKWVFRLFLTLDVFDLAAVEFSLFDGLCHKHPLNTEKRDYMMQLAVSYDRARWYEGTHFRLGPISLFVKVPKSFRIDWK